MWPEAPEVYSVLHHRHWQRVRRPIPGYQGLITGSGLTSPLVASNPCQRGTCGLVDLSIPGHAGPERNSKPGAITMWIRKWLKKAAKGRFYREFPPLRDLFRPATEEQGP